MITYPDRKKKTVAILIALGGPLTGRFRRSAKNYLESLSYVEKSLKGKIKKSGVMLPNTNWKKVYNFHLSRECSFET